MAEKQLHITPPQTQHTSTEEDGLVTLLATCKRNDRSAQRKLYDQYAPLLYGIIRRYTNDSQASQEIHSDAFYRIFTKLEQYRFEGSFEGWMRRITVNAIADYFRRQPVSSVSLPEDTSDVQSYADTDGLGKLAYQELLNMIHELPLTQRTVFNLFVFEQYSHKEIGNLLGITENNSRWQINDARRRLKEKIKSINR